MQRRALIVLPAVRIISKRFSLNQSAQPQHRQLLLVPLSLAYWKCRGRSPPITSRDSSRVLCCFVALLASSPASRAAKRFCLLYYWELVSRYCALGGDEAFPSAVRPNIISTALSADDCEVWKQNCLYTVPANSRLYTRKDLRMSVPCSYLERSSLHVWEAGIGENFKPAMSMASVAFLWYKK